MELVNRDFNAALNVRKMCSAEREACVADAIQLHRARAPARRVQGETKNDGRWPVKKRLVRGARGGIPVYPPWP